MGALASFLRIGPPVLVAGALAACGDSASGSAETAAGPDLPVELDLPVDTCDNGKIEPDEFCYSVELLDVEVGALLVGDFDGDGLPDVGRPRSGEGKTTFNFWPGDGSGAFGPPTPRQELGESVYLNLVVNIDGVGGDDLMGLTGSTGAITAFLNNGGEFGPAVISTPKPADPFLFPPAIFNAGPEGGFDLLVEGEGPNGDYFLLRGAEPPDAGTFVDTGISFPADPDCYTVRHVPIPAFASFGQGSAQLLDTCDAVPEELPITVVLPDAQGNLVVTRGGEGLPRPQGDRI